MRSHPRTKLTAAPAQTAGVRRALGWTLAGVTLWWLGRSVLRHARRYELAGRRVLVTGGSRGLGLLLARRLVAQGAKVAICARDGDELERARRDLVGLGGEVLALPCDVGVRESVERLVQTVVEQWAGVDVLINNAGVVRVGPQQAMTAEDYEQAMQVHFFGPLYATQAVLPGMRRRGEGRIVNIASIGGLISVPHLVAYSASKFALVGMSEGLRAELLRDGIYVTTVCPGLMRTGSADHAWFKGRNEAEYAWFSTSASAPVFVMSAARAANRMLEACRGGQANLVLSLPARVGALIHGLAPAVTSDTLGWVNRLLPDAGGVGSRAVAGRDSRPRRMPGWLTHLGDRAPERNNENPPHKAEDGLPPAGNR
jgi:NAD(P)-dependent dehydrogenase (short-subunit alcohol dehydrogenase family)